MRIDGYSDALTQIRRGKKTSHWIWYIFPQLRGLCHSAFSDYYGIANANEAKQFLCHKLLGKHLRTICSELKTHTNKSIEDVFSPIDAMKLRSSMTLFDYISPNDVFFDILSFYYDGHLCNQTLAMLKQTDDNES